MCNLFTNLKDDSFSNLDHRVNALSINGFFDEFNNVDNFLTDINLSKALKEIHIRSINIFYKNLNYNFLKVRNFKLIFK